MVYKDQGRYADAEPLFIRSVAIKEKARGRNHPDLATAVHNLGSNYRAEGRYAEAEPLYKRALAIQEVKLSTEHPALADTLNALGYMLVFRVHGRYAEAEGLFKRALAIREKALGENHTDIGQNLSNPGLVYAAQGKYDDMGRKRLGKRVPVGPGHSSIRPWRSSVGELYGACGPCG